ncbi:MAG: hypothetical protein ABEJ57_00995 [Halobacteriaceae archaeon]
MVVPDVFGAVDGNVILGGALTIGWLAVLGIGLYQYRQGARSREWFYMTITVVVLSLAFSLSQVATAFTGVVENGVVALAVGLFCAGVATGVKWWRLRSGRAGASAQA